MSVAVRKGWYGWLVCALAATFYCYEYLLRIAPAVMVPQLMQNFHINAQGLGLLSALYYAAYTPLQVIVGVTLDYYGSRRVLVLAIGACALGSLLFGLTSELHWAGLGRLMIGMGSAFAFIGVLKLAAVWLPHNRFALFTGITTALGMLGAMVGQIEMAWAVEQIGWHRVAMGGAFIGALLIPLFILFVHEPELSADVDGSVDSIRDTLRGLWEVCANRQIVLAGLIGCMLYLSLSAFAEMWAVSFLQVAVGAPLVRAAEMNSMVFLGWLIGAPFHGWLSDQLQRRRPQLVVGSLMAAFFISVILLWPSLPEPVIFVLLLLFGFSAAVQVLCFAIARDVSSLRRVGTAVAMVNLLVMLGGMVFQPLAGMLLDWFAAYRIALLFVPLGMIVAAMLATALHETYREEELGQLEVQ